MSGYYLIKPSPIKRREIKAQYLNFIPYKRIYSNLAMSGYYLVKPSPIKSKADQSAISELYTTGSPNTLSAIKINVLLFTCVLVSFLSRLEGI